MPTIKTKKEMNLAELIEWAIKKDIKDEKFYSKNGCHISIDYRGHVFLWDIRLNEIFTVEVEEEITEDTVLSTIIECEEDDTFWVFKEITLKEMHESKCLKETTKYYKDEDEKMYLIWRDGKLVE